MFTYVFLYLKKAVDLIGRNIEVKTSTVIMILKKLN